MDNEILSRAITFLVFAVVGYLFAGKIAPPKQPFVWIAWLTAVVAAGYIGVTTRLVSIIGFSLYVSNMLQGLGYGLLAGFLMRRGRR